MHILYKLLLINITLKNNNNITKNGSVITKRKFTQDYKITDW
jgi:hypothetical protein